MSFHFFFDADTRPIFLALRPATGKVTKKAVDGAINASTHLGEGLRKGGEGLRKSGKLSRGLDSNDFDEFDDEGYNDFY